MAYRKIHVNGNEWQYTVGRKFVHIKGPDGQNFNCQVEDIGSTVYCSCGPEYNCYDYGPAVTPSDVKKFVESKLR